MMTDRLVATCTLLRRGQMSEHMFLAPASGRRPQGWLARLLSMGSDAGKTLKNLGVAGLISYGIMNILYYCTVFSVMLLRVC